MKYYIKMTKTNSGTVSYKAHKCSYGWFGEGDKDIAWKFSKKGAKQIIERYESERDSRRNIWAEDTIWELEEAGE